MVAPVQSSKTLGDEVCPVCQGKSEALDVVDFNKSCIEAAGKRLPPSGVPVYYFLCGQCGFCFAPQFRNWTPEDFKREIYNEGYAAVDPDYKDVRPEGNAGFLIDLLKTRPAGFRHLDYGGGSGLLSERLRAAAWDSATYDPFSDKSIPLATLGQSDLVSAFEVFEHVAHPERLMDELSKLLKPEGVLLLSTLVSDGVIATGRRLDWWYAAPRNGHVSLFSTKSLQLLAEKSGFRCLSLSPNLHLFFRALPEWMAGALKTRAVKRSPAPVRTAPPLRLDPAGFNALRMCRSGPLVYNRNDLYIGRALEKYGESCWAEHEFLSLLVRPGSLVVEVGSNIGTHTVGLSSFVGKNGVVMAFEPQRILFQTLCANLALNQCINVRAFNEAVGAVEGQIKVPLLDPAHTGNFGGLSLLGARDGEAVPIRTVDSLRLPACHLLKADVEGMELQVLEGARATIARFRPLLYLENDRQDRSKALLSTVLEWGYQAYWHLPPLFNPNNFAGDPENIYAGIVSVNVLCVPAEKNITVNHLRRITSADDSWRPHDERERV